jgi:uncharacterized protein YkwD
LVLALLGVIVFEAQDAQTAARVEATAEHASTTRPPSSTEPPSTTATPSTTTEPAAPTTEEPPPTSAPIPPPAPTLARPTEPPPITDATVDAAPIPAPTVEATPIPASEPEPDAPPAAIAPVASACNTSQGGLAGAVVAAMNADRAAAGVGPLCANSQLAGFAQSWSNWMAQNQSLAHQDLNALLAQTSFSTMAENIAGGSGLDTAEAIEALWMNSAPHRANILNGSFTAVGVGIAHSSDGQAWVVADFGG